MPHDKPARKCQSAHRIKTPLLECCCRKGIPAAAIVSGEDTLLYVTKAGELANAHRMWNLSIVDFSLKSSPTPHPRGIELRSEEM